MSETDVYPYYVVVAPGGRLVHRLEGVWPGGVATLCGYSFRAARLSKDMPPGVDSCRSCAARMKRSFDD